MVENPNKRLIHFFFKNPFGRLENEFSLRLRLYLQGDLEGYLTNQNERYEAHLSKIKEDDIEDIQESKSPFVQEVTKRVEFDMHSIKEISLATADDPFFDKPNKKHFPELVVLNNEGEAIAKIDETTDPNSDSVGRFIPSCRDNKLKINDDRKITIRLSQLDQSAQMVLLFVRIKAVAGEYERALYRLLNEDTNQTLDTNEVAKSLKVKPKKVKYAQADGEGDDDDDEEDEEEDNQDDDGEGDDEAQPKE